MNIFKNKKFKYGGLSVLFTVIFVVAVVLINVVVNLVLSRFDVKVDLSNNSIYSIEDTTAKYLSGIDDDITITVAYDEDGFVSQGDYYNQTNEIIKRFCESNSRINVRYLPLDANPTVYAAYGSNLSAGCIIVESKNTGRYQVLSTSDYINIVYSFNGETISQSDAYAYYQYGMGDYLTYDTSAAAEQALASKIMSVTDENPVRVAFLTGYGATESDTLTSLLETNVYVTEKIDATLLSTIDEDIDYLFIYAPTTDYTADALKAIDIWLDNGGTYGKSLVYIPSAEAVDTPNLNSFLKDWGIEIGNSYIVQTDGNYAYSSNATYQMLEVQDSDYSTGINITSAATLGDQLRPITLLWDENSNYATTSILKTYAGAKLRPFNVGDAWTVDDVAETDAYNVLVESNKVTYTSGEEVKSRVFVFGGSTLIHDQFLSASQTNNDEILMNLFNVTSKKTDLGLTFSEKSFDIQVATISEAAKNMIAVVFAVIIPIIIIAAGIFVWVRRRRK